MKNQKSNHLFFLIVFIISWGAVFLLAGPKGFPITDDEAMMMGMAILLGPTLASIILTARAGRSEIRSLFSRWIRWRVNVRWYAAALFMAPLITLATLGLLALFSFDFQPSILLSTDKTGLIISAIVAGLVVGTCEELGWTGFAVPRLLKNRGILSTGVLVGLVWGLWHFPLFWQADSFTTGPAFLLLIAQLFSWLPPYRILMVWLYKNTDSLLLIILMHTSLVATLMIFDPVLEGTNLIIFILVRAVLLWTVAAVILRRDGKKA